MRLVKKIAQLTCWYQLVLKSEEAVLFHRRMDLVHDVGSRCYWWGLNCSQSISPWRNGRHSWPALPKNPVIHWHYALVITIERSSNGQFKSDAMWVFIGCTANGWKKHFRTHPFTVLLGFDQSKNTQAVTDSFESVLLELDTPSKPRHTLYGPNHAKVWRSIGLATCVSGWSWQSSSSVRPSKKTRYVEAPHRT